MALLDGEDLDLRGSGLEGNRIVQLLKDAIQTVEATEFAPYGIMSVQGGSTAQEDIGPTPEILVAWNTDGIANGMTVSSADDYITATVAGTYEVHCNLSFSGTGSSTVTFEIYVYDDSATSWNASGFAVQRKLGTGGDVGAVGVTGFVALDVSDRVAIYVATDGATDDVTVVEAQLQVDRFFD